MDAIVNFGRLLERSNHKYEKAHVPDTGLYSKPLRGAIPIILAVIVVYNVVLVILGAILTAGINYGFPEGTDNKPIADDTTPTLLYRLIMFFYWCTIPLFALLNSVIELIKRRRRTLRSLYITIMASIVLCTWFIAIPLWTTCAFSEGGEMEDAEYCLVSFTKAGPDSSWSGVLDLAWYMPWFVIPAIVLYICYLVLGAIALHRERTSRPKTPMISTKPDWHELHRTPSAELLTPASRPSSYKELISDPRQSEEIVMPEAYQTVFTEELGMR